METTYRNLYQNAVGPQHVTLEDADDNVGWAGPRLAVLAITVDGDNLPTVEVIDRRPKKKPADQFLIVNDEGRVAARVLSLADALKLAQSTPESRVFRAPAESMVEVEW